MNLRRLLRVPTIPVAFATPSTPAVVDERDCVREIATTARTREYGERIPHRLRINPAYGSEYARLMNIAIKAGAIKKDYDCAIINFRRAQEISGATDSEVRRGLLGATLAKQIQSNPNETSSPYQVWLILTGEYAIE